MAPHKLNLQIPELLLRDNKRKLQLSFATTISLELPHEEFITPDELWKQLDVQLQQGFHFSLQLLWKGKPLPETFNGISETLGRQLVTAAFWEQQLSLKPSLSIPSADRIVIIPKPTIPFAIPPSKTTPICHLLSVENVLSFEPRDNGDGDGDAGLGVEECLVLSDVVLKGLFKGVLGKDGVTGGVFLGGYSSELSERRRHWEGIASSVVSVAGRVKEDNEVLHTRLDELRTRCSQTDIPTCLKAGMHHITSQFLLSKSRKIIKPSIASDDENLSSPDDKFYDLNAENEAMEENSQDSIEDDDWLFDDLEDSQLSFDGEILMEEEERMFVLEERVVGGSLGDMVDDEELPEGRDLNMLEVSETMQLSHSSLATTEMTLDGRYLNDILLDDELENQHPHPPAINYTPDTPDFHHDMLSDSECQSVCSMLDDDGHSFVTQSTISDIPSPASPESTDAAPVARDEHFQGKPMQQYPNDIFFDDDEESATQMLEEFMDI